MHVRLLSVLACPECEGELSLVSIESDAGGSVTRGALDCSQCPRSYPIEAGIPRFVERHPADASFGYQWNVFRQEQLDSWNGTTISSKRFHAETGWGVKDIDGRWVLDVGCGAGRFLEIAAQYPCDAVGVDVSSAIDAAAMTLKGRTNVHLVQADVYRLPFRPGAFDACYCIGVAQHTPDPPRALAALPRLLSRGGRLAVTVYERKPWTLLNGKYLLRPFTRRLNKRALLLGIKALMPILFPLTEGLFRLPLIGRAFTFVVPVANYVEMRELSLRRRYGLALLDTFDRLAPEYDRPLTEREVRDALSSSGAIALRRLRNPGVNIVGERVRS